MSSLEKRQPNRRGSTHGSRKCSDGISDASSVESFMDDTDREVSSLTDRAFRSLCIGEDAIYNDLEVSSPAHQHKAYTQEALQKKELGTIFPESSSYGVQYVEAERKSEVASTFQRSEVDIAQEHILKEENLSYISNGSMEAMWQQKSSTCRVSSLIKTYSSRDSYCDSDAPDTVKDKYQDFNKVSWDKSALLSIQTELSRFSSGYHPNHFPAVAQMNTAASSRTRFKALNTTNCFFHSESSPFLLWKDYNRFPFEKKEPSGFVPATEFPLWYESPLYKELTTTHNISSSPAEGKQLTQRKIEDVAPTKRSRSTVIQKASALEKRCESEIASNCPPWKNNNFVKNKLPSNRPSTVSPNNEKVHRPDSSLLCHSKHTNDIQHKVGKVCSSELSSSITPFNISQLLTPVIPDRQGTETSEILQFAHTPMGSECDGDLKPQSNAKQLRDSYKSKASSLLFNLKDNRKRVKSTYSPTKFKSSEISDRNKQPSNLEGRESRLSEVSGAWGLCNPVQPNHEISLFKAAEHKHHADKLHNNMPIVSQYSTTNCSTPYMASQNNHPHTNRQNEHYELSTNSGLAIRGTNSVRHINNSSSPCGSARLETENIFSIAQSSEHQSAKMSAKQTFCKREDAGHQNFVIKTSSGYINNQVNEENLSGKRTGPVSMVTKEMVSNDGLKNAPPYRGEIAALIEMDKQRKATARQYLPSACDSYTMRKELCINKMNENINGSWITNDTQIQDIQSSFQTYGNKYLSNKLVKEEHASTSATSQNLHEFQHNGLERMACSSNETNFTRGSEITILGKGEAGLQRNMKHSTSNMEPEKGYSQRAPFLQSVEDKYHHNEGSVAYQPYKYESNKQWHIGITENIHARSEECMSRQLQKSEIKAEQPGESNYVHSLSRTSCIQHESTAHAARTSQRNLITENRAKSQEHKPTYSIAPTQIYHKQGDMNTNLGIPNTQGNLQYNNKSQNTADRFNINDILSVRDNEQAKRVRENKHSFNGRVADRTKFENRTSPVASDVAEDTAAKTEPSNGQSLARKDRNIHCKDGNINESYGYVRKELHIPSDVKERSGKDVLISNNEKITPRAVSYKEKGQTKQEILTSKLKAHAQKEISAIKEKGLAKHAIPSRNLIKQSTTVSNEKGQINQEVHSQKKETTAEKPNHLFQDSTYSSVYLYKEQRNKEKDEPNNVSLIAEKVELPTKGLSSEKDKVATEKEKIKFQMIKPEEERITEGKEKKPENHTFDKNEVHQPNMQFKANQLSKPSKDNEKERCLNDSIVANGRILAIGFSNSSNLKGFSDEESVVKKEDKTSSNLPTTNISNNTEFSTFKVNGNDSPKREVMVNGATNQLTLYTIRGEAITLERSVNKAQTQLTKVNTHKSATDCNTLSLKCYDLSETTKSKDSARKEIPLMLPNARQFEISTRKDKASSDWTEDEVSSVERTVDFTDARTAFPNKQTMHSNQEREHFQSRTGGMNENHSECLPKSSKQMYCKTNREVPEKETWQENQNIQAEAVHISKTNEDTFLQELQNTDTLKSSQNARKELRSQTTLRSNKEVNTKLDSSEETKYSLQQESNIKPLHNENSEVEETVSQLKLKIIQENQTIIDKDVIENNNQLLQGDNERDSEHLRTEHHKQNAKDFHEHIKTTPMEKSQLPYDIETNGSIFLKTPDTEHESEEKSEEKSEENIFMPIITTNSNDPQLSSLCAPDKSADITNPVPEKHIIHIASKEDRTPTDEPIIYSICVSSPSEAVSEDEPIIFSISVSSISSNSIPTGPENAENCQNPLSIEQADKDNKETFSKNTKESDVLESKEDSKEVKLLFNNDMVEQETLVRKHYSPACNDILDYDRSTEVDNISSSYKNLLAKYGHSDRDTIQLESDQKEQDKKEEDEKEEYSHNYLCEIENNARDDDHAPIKKPGDFTKTHSPTFRQPKFPETSPEQLGNAEENQCITHSEQEHPTANGAGTQRADGGMYSDRDTKQDVSAKQEILMSEVVAICEDIVDTRSSKQIMASGNVQMKENKQVGQKAQTIERGLKEYDDYVVNKNTEMVQVKCENNTERTAGFTSTYISNKSLTHSCDDSPQPGSKSSTNDCQIHIKTQDSGVYLVQNSQNTMNPTGNTKSPTLQFRTQEESVRDALKQEKVSKECLNSGDNQALESNRKGLVCKSEFLEPVQVISMRINEVKVSRVIVSENAISTSTNEQINKNGTGNQNQIKYAFPAEKTDQNVFTVSEIPLVPKDVHSNDNVNKLKVDTVRTRDAVPPHNESENTASAKVTRTKESSVLGMTEDDLERLENKNWKREPAEKETETLKSHKVTPLNKDLKQGSSVIKGDKDAVCESSKINNNFKEAKAQPQDKYDHFVKLVTDDTRKINEQTEVKAGIGAVKESAHIIKWDLERNGKVLRDKNDQLNDHHPQKDLPERKGNTNDGKKSFESDQNNQLCGTVLVKKGTLTKPDITQKEKKTTRPEISALADYARLKVISAEDDATTEKDLLEKMNTYQKYNLSSVESPKVNVSMSAGSTEQSKQLSVNKKPENLNPTAMALQVQERQTYKIADELLAGHNQWSEVIAYPKLGTIAKSSDNRVFSVKDTESSKEKTHHMQSNTKKSLTAQDYRYSRGHEPSNSQANLPVQTQIENKTDPKLPLPLHANMLEKTFCPQVKNSQSVPQVSIQSKLNNVNRQADNQIKEDVKDEETTEELQYYIVNAMESETKSKNNHEPLSLSQKISSKKDLPESHATAPRSNTSSPAMGKAIMFRVKDNTGKTSSVTKTVRPRFHRSLSEEFRIGSPFDSCCASEKDKVEYDRENDPKVSINTPISHEQSVTSYQVSRAKEIQSRNKILSPEFIAQKEPRSYNRRSHMIEDDESRSLTGTMSSQVDSLATRSVVMTDSRSTETQHIRRTYARPKSSCYERPESACYERPESACSDMRPSSKPPAVPPKSERALRRAKRLTTRRVKKEDDKMTSDTPVQPESKSIHSVHSLPASPMMQMSTPQSVQSVQASPPISHYRIEPNYPPPAHRIVAHSFPMTQRKLLQDPNSGQIFMVDMPVQVKTKTFIDPETGKYLQLNVRQRAQSTLSQTGSMGVLGQPYVVYPGFLPMSVPVSSIPSLRSSSQMSATSTFSEEQHQLKTNHEPREQEIYEPGLHRNVQQHNRPGYKPQEQTVRRNLHNENVRMTPRQTHIITMSELEDFVIENT